MRVPVIGALAVSAGVHLGLAPGHLTGSPLLAASFVAAALALAVTALAVELLPESRIPLLAAAGLLGTLIAAYAVTRTGDPVDALGVATKVVEAAGLTLALLAGPGRTGRFPAAALALALATVLAVGVAAGGPGEGHDHTRAGVPQSH